MRVCDLTVKLFTHSQTSAVIADAIDKGQFVTIRFSKICHQLNKNSGVPKNWISKSISSNVTGFATSCGLKPGTHLRQRRQSPELATNRQQSRLSNLSRFVADTFNFVTGLSKVDCRRKWVIFVAQMSNVISTLFYCIRRLRLRIH